MADFWKSTPRELAIFTDAYIRRRTWLAWTIAALGRAENFPEFEDFAMHNQRKTQSMSEEELAHNMRLWQHVLGEAVGI